MVFFDGVVGLCNVSCGVYLVLGDIIIIVIDDSKMKLDFSVLLVYLFFICFWVLIVVIFWVFLE